MANSITPPPEPSDEQVGNWLIDDGYPWEPSEQAVITITTSRLKNVARQAFQAGADQELEACCREVQTLYSGGSRLRARRRPQPPSLKEQALAALIAIATGANDIREQHQDFDTIRAALEALPND